MLFVDFVDELGSGIPVADAPTIRSELALEYAGTSWFLLAAPLALAILLETPLLLLSDRWPRRRIVAIALGVMAICLGLAAVSTSPWMLAVAFAMWAAAGGVGVGVAQATLMAAFPHDRERMMTRWTLMGMLGDAATPLVLLGAAALGLDWRAATGMAAAMHVLAAIGVALRRSEPEPESESASEAASASASASAWTRLREGLRNRALLLWLGATALCCLLDEIFVVFGTLFMRDQIGASTVEQGVVLFAFAVGGGAGLLATDRMLTRVPPMKLLALSGLACAVSFALWIAATSVPFSIALALVVGFAGAPLYPIAQARAYAMEPDRPGLVHAIDQIYAPVPVLAPIALGFVADHAGLVAALALLLVEPLCLAALALASLLERRREAIAATPPEPTKRDGCSTTTSLGANSRAPRS